MPGNSYADLTTDVVPKSLLRKVNSWKRGGARISLTNAEARRLVKYNVVIDDNGCWLWRLRTINGYGVLPSRITAALDLGTEKVHRAAYTLWKKKPAAGMLVCHDCRPAADNTKCCNPSHLWEGSHTQNMRDMVIKGRVPDRRGAKHPRFGKKHTEEARRKIRLARARQANPWEGRHHTDATKQLLRAANLGKKQSQETIDKAVAKRIGQKRSPEAKAKMREAAFLREAKKRALRV